MTEWSTIQGVIGRVSLKLEERAVRGRFVNMTTITHEIGARNRRTNHER